MAFLFTVVFLSSIVPSAPTPAPEAIVHDLPDPHTANHSPQALGSPRLKPCRTEISIPSLETRAGIQRAHVALCCWVHSLVKRIPGSRGNGLEGLINKENTRHREKRQKGSWGETENSCIPLRPGPGHPQCSYRPPLGSPKPPPPGRSSLPTRA